MLQGIVPRKVLDAGGAIYYSRNSGDSWDVLAAHLPPILSLEAALV